MTGASVPAPVLEIENVVKRFGAIEALMGV